MDAAPREGLAEPGRHVRVAVVGAGFGGLAAAIRLKQRGDDDFLVFERADRLGGTWRDNSYPGCACDIPSHLYSYSFALNPGWSRTFSPQPEIWNYLEACATRFGVRPHLRLGHEVLAATWDERDRHWRIDTSGGTYTADVVIAAAGPLAEPAVPDLPGLPTFAGTAFHSARWRHDHDLTGRRVAVVGTGASAAQFVPEIVDRVASLRLFQRTPAWIMPRRDRAFTPAEHRLYRAVPAAQRLARAGVYTSREVFALLFLHPRLMRFANRGALRHLRESVPDPALRAKLTPGYLMGCKRIVVSSDFLPAVARPNVEVVTEGIREVRPQGMVTVDGAVHDVDTIIFGTGFHVSDMPIAERIRGRGGRTLADAWQGSPKAYLGVTVHGFPNLFLLLGPNTGLGHTSVVYMIESQVAYILSALSYLDRTGAGVVEPRAEAQADFVSTVDGRMVNTVWSRGGCHSWYLDATGRNSTIWPGFTWRYRRRLRRFDPAAYHVPTEVPA
jgi:cation diffusion facilitator CzcD-associated flavoprotein CzcO